MNNLTITIPLPMPTWNRLLGMSWQERMKTRHLIHQFSSLSIQHATGELTSTAYQSKLLLMHASKQKYLKMIRPSTAKALPSLKKKHPKEKDQTTMSSRKFQYPRGLR